MVTYVEIKGFEEFAKYTENIDPNGAPVFFFFSGSKLPDGNSWCPDCVEDVDGNAKPVVTPRRKVILKPWVTLELLKIIRNRDKLHMKTKRAPDDETLKITYKSYRNYCNGMLKKAKAEYDKKITEKTAEPVVKAYLTELKKEVIFAYVDVGDREYWKDRACPFRTDSRTKLMVIPTLIKWKGVQRLEGSQCNKRELLQMMFEEED